ncbi:PQQ-binding-like beta-propeller repeat protein [bacterium]|nr:PQQ-binding-like beta-propeller repeat protein [bacterium]
MSGSHRKTTSVLMTWLLVAPVLLAQPAVPRAPGSRNTPQKPAAKAALQNEPTTLPTDPNGRRKLEEAAALLNEKEIDRGLELLQSILNSEETWYVRDGEQNWKQSNEAAEELILGSVPAVLQRYREINDDEANHLLDEALRSNNIESLAQIARRFFLTGAGLRALDRVASWNLDTGRASLALFYFDRILSSTAHREKPLEAVRLKREISLAILHRDEQSPPLTGRVLVKGRPQDAAKLLTQFQDEWKQLSEELKPQPPSTSDEVSKRAGWPLLASSWQWPLTHDPMIGSIIDEMTSASLPRQAPLLFGHRPVVLDGRLYFRDFDSTVAIDAQNGQKIEEFVNQTAITSEFLKPENRTYAMSPNPSGFECTFVANQVYGELTTDESRIYLIDDLPLNPNPYLPPFANKPGGNAGSERGRNTLVALDADTLAVHWQLGKQKREAIDEPIYFFGPPTPIHDRLYVIGECRSEIGLYCVAPETGEILWRQLLAVASRSVDSDIFRRSQACRVVDADGILLCPTNLFLLVAIDPITRSRLWEYSLVAEGQIPVQYTLGTQTIPPPTMILGTDAPIVSNNAVIVSEPLGHQIHCIDLNTGKPRWRAPRESDWYLGSVNGSMLVTIGSQQARGIRMGNGKVAWKVPIPLPSGRGLAIDGNYLLPTTDGRVLVMDMGTGRTKRELISRDRQPIGSILASKDAVLAVGATGLQSFPLMERVEAQVNQLLTANPKDVRALFQRGLVHLTLGATLDAIADLQGGAAGDAALDEVKQSRTLLFDLAAHEGLIQASIPESFVNELGAMASTDVERGIYLRLKAEFLIRAGKTEEIVSLLDQHEALHLNEAIPSDWNFLRRTPRSWSRAFLRKSLSRLNEQKKELLIAKYRGRLATATREKNADELKVLAFLFEGQEIGCESRLALGEISLADEQPAEAEMNFIRAAEGDSAKVTTEALRQLVDLALLTDRPRDAQYYLDELDSPEITKGLSKDDREQISSSIEKFKERLTPIERPVVSPPWNSVKIQASSERSFRPEPNRRVAFPARSGLPSFADKIVVLDHQRWDLEFVGRSSGKIDWKIEGMPKSLAYQQPLLFQQLGSLMLFEQSNSIYAISGLEKRLHWHRGFEDPSAELTQVVSTSGRVRTVRASSATYLSGQMLWPKIIGCGPNHLVVRAGKMLHVIDPWTNEVLWTRSDLNQDQFITSDREYVIIVSPRGEWSAHRTLDGELLLTGEIGPDIRFMNGTHGRRIALFQSDGLNSQRKLLRMYDPIIKTHAWKQVLPAGTEWKMIDDKWIILFDDKRNLSVVRIDSGELIIHEQLTAEESKESIGPTMLHAYSDGKRLYVGSNQNFANENIYPVSPSTNVRMMTVHGWLRAYDLKTSKKIWHREIYNRNLLYSPGEDLPYLVMIGNRLVDIGDDQRRPATTVDLIDKETGRSVASQNHDQYGTMVELAYSDHDQWIEVRGNNLRIRFEFLRDGQTPQLVPTVENSATSPMMRRFFDRARKAREKREQDAKASPR